MTLSEQAMANTHTARADSSQRNRRRRHLGMSAMTALIGVLVLGAVGIGGTIAVRSQMTADNQASAVDLYTANVTSFDITIPASGELEALRKIEVRNQTEGRATIKWIIDEGEFVKKGDLLVELASDELQNRLDDEISRFESAKSDLVTAEKNVELQRNENASNEAKALLALEIAKLELARWEEGEHAQSLKDLAWAVEKAKRNVERFEQDYQDSIILEREGFMSESELEEDRIRLDDARAELERAILAQRVYLDYEVDKERKTRTSDVEEAEAELERVRVRNSSQLAQKEADLRNKRQQLELRERRLQQTRDELENARIEAPSDGLVVYGTSVGGNWWRREDPLQIGQQISSNELLIILPDPTQMVASVKVHESQTSLVQPGLKAEVRVDALPDLALSGTVQSLGVMAEQGSFGQVREFTVKVLIDGENKWDLKPSMRCKTDILVGRVNEVLAVPVQAVYPERGRHYVWVPEGNKFRRQWVQPGRASETMIEIASGLEAGDRVLLREPTPGERVAEETEVAGGPGMGGPGMGGPGMGAGGGRPPYGAGSGSETGRPGGSGRPGAGASGRPGSSSSSGEQPQRPAASDSDNSNSGSGSDDAPAENGDGVTRAEPTDASRSAEAAPEAETTESG